LSKREELFCQFAVEDSTFDVNLPQTAANCALLQLFMYGNLVTTRKFCRSSDQVKAKALNTLAGKTAQGTNPWLRE